MDPTMRPPAGSGAPMPLLPSYVSSHHAPAMFSVKDILGRTFSIYRANFFAFLKIMALVTIPAIIAIVMVGGTPWLAAFPMLLGFFTWPIGTGAITHGVYEHLKGRSTTVGQCLSVGFGNLFRVFGVALLSSLVIVAGAFVCAIPGMIAVAVFAVAIPAAVHERTSVVDALRRSARLTEGYRGTIFVVYFLIGWVANLIVIPVDFRLRSAGHPQEALIVTQLLSVLLLGLAATASAVMYYRLCSIKESMDVRDVASVFD